MLDAGLIDYYKSLYLRHWDKHSSSLGPQKDGQPVTLRDLYLVLLYVFAGGLCLASGILILENVLQIYNRVSLLLFTLSIYVHYDELD